MASEEPLDLAHVNKFDFVSDSEFRASLASDYLDLRRCFDAGAWKAVHVLSGSVVEALLTEYLLTAKHDGTFKKDPLTLHLTELVASCKDIGVLSERAADLSVIVKGYRNLIHPGRLVRLKERVDENSAKVAIALVEMIIDEVSAARKKIYGYTAEQVVTKLEKDPSSLAILSHILKETSHYERERLLLEVIPARYPGAPNSAALQRCFRAAFDTLSENGKTKVTANFVRIIKEGSADEVSSYETAFFKASDLAFLPPKDIELVKAHLLAQLDWESEARLLFAFRGIGRFLNISEVGGFIDTLATIVFVTGGKEIASVAESTLIAEYTNLTDGESREIAERVLEPWGEAMSDEDERKVFTRLKTKLGEISLRLTKTTTSIT